MQASRGNKAIEFKGGTLSATTAYIRDTNAMKLADAMHTLLGGMPDFFGGEPTILDFGQLGETPARIDWGGLTSLMRRYRLQPVAVRNLPEQFADGARKIGLAVLEGEAGLKAGPLPVEPAAAPAPRAEAPEPAPAPAPAPAPQAPAPLAVGTMVVDKPLRSGQQVYARGGDLVLLGGVSNGAEVIADGNIHCYGPLRGRAIAGAQGNTQARIFTTSLGAELVSIAGVFRTFDRGLPEDVGGRAAIVRLSGEGEKAQLKVEPLSLG
ncbi:septum site-determining protein MinC [Niveibacterium sp. SC-1]|uniref:septum site-determining protein MinC n=1 Tax=Niveibacterium sp. SC-1 TaxID=3135646 RepID=UPI00311FAAA4